MNHVNKKTAKSRTIRVCFGQELKVKSFVIIAFSTLVFHFQLYQRKIPYPPQAVMLRAAVVM